MSLETKTTTAISGGVLYRFVAYEEPLSGTFGLPEPVDLNAPAKEPVGLMQMTRDYALVLLRDAVAISGKSIDMLPDSLRFIAREMGINDNDIGSP